MKKLIWFFLAVFLSIILCNPCQATNPLSQTKHLKEGKENQNYIDFIQISDKLKIISKTPQDFFFHKESGAVFAKSPKAGKYEITIQILDQSGAQIAKKTYEIIIKKAKEETKKIKNYFIEIDNIRYSKKDIHKLEKKSGIALNIIKKALPDEVLRTIDVPGSKQNSGKLTQDQGIQYIKNMVNLIKIANKYQNSKMGNEAKKNLKTELQKHKTFSNMLHQEFQNSSYKNKLKNKLQNMKDQGLI